MYDTFSSLMTRLMTQLDSPPAIVAVAFLLSPVAAATLVLTWHGLRGSDPGPAGNQLLKLVELILLRGRRRP
jgi:hypothetical protein